MLLATQICALVGAVTGILGLFLHWWRGRVRLRLEARWVFRKDGTRTSMLAFRIANTGAVPFTVAMVGIEGSAGRRTAIFDVGFPKSRVGLPKKIEVGASLDVFADIRLKKEEVAFAFAETACGRKLSVAISEKMAHLASAS